MNAKRFFHVSAGLLLLVIAYSFGARRADADFDLGGPIIGLANNDNIVMRADGTFWHADPYDPTLQPSGWEQLDWTPPPIPLDQIKYWSVGFVVTVDGYVWKSSNLREWARTPQPIPFPPVGVEGKSMSDVKGSYRR